MNSPQKTLLRNFLSSQEYMMLENIAYKLCAKIKENSAVRGTEWETLQAVIGQDSEVRGIKRLLQELNEGAKEP